MIPHKQTTIAVLNIALLLSLHLHPIIAERRLAGIEVHESNVGVGSETLSQLFRFEREEMEAMTEAKANKFCGFGYAKTMRFYHFEFDIVGEEQNDVRHFAGELIRSPKAPRLVMHAGSTWSVRLTGDSKIPIDWVLTPFPNSSDAGYSIQIDFLYEVQYIKHLDKTQGIEIKFNNGTLMSLVGGLYYPDEILAEGIKQDRKGKKKEKPDPTAEKIVANRSVGAHAAKEGVGVLGSAIAKHTGSFATKGALGGVAVGFGLSAAFHSAVMLMNSILNSFLTSIGAATTVSIAINIAPLTAAQILSFTTFYATFGLLAGIAVGLGVGLVVGIPAAIATLIHKWVKMHKELRLSASEKIFAKLKCHRQFKRSPLNGNVLVPRKQKGPS